MTEWLKDINSTFMASQNQSRVKYHKAYTEHDIDRISAGRAWQKVKAKDSGIRKRAAAFAITNSMNVENKLGIGVKRMKKKCSIKTKLNKIVKATTNSTIPSINSKSVIRIIK